MPSTTPPSSVRSVSEFQQAPGVDVSMGLVLGIAGGSAKMSIEEKSKATSEATFRRESRTPGIGLSIVGLCLMTECSVTASS